MAAKDRWHQLKAAIEDSNMTAADTAVYKFLLGESAYGIAEMRPEWTPTRIDISRKTKVSLSQVNYSVEHLQRHGWVTVIKHGRTAAYEFATGADCDCTGRIHRRGSVQRDLSIGATDTPPVAPVLVQPIGATPQVGNGFAVVERSEKEFEPQPAHTWADPNWPKHPDGRKLSFAEIMAAHGSDPWG